MAKVWRHLELGCGGETRWQAVADDEMRMTTLVAGSDSVGEAWSSTAVEVRQCLELGCGGETRRRAVADDKMRMTTSVAGSDGVGEARSRTAAKLGGGSAPSEAQCVVGTRRFALVSM